MSERYPGYDVLTKRNSPSWNEQTRRVVDQRLATAVDSPRFLDAVEWPTLRAICARIVPQPPDRLQPIPVAALVDMKLFENRGDGYRDARLPPLREAWRRALRALDAESQRGYAKRFHELPPLSQDDLLHAMQQGECRDSAWGDMPTAVFFTQRLLHDVTSAYYSHPTAWSEIGFGGPAAPRGYVRMGLDRHDPWEAAEAHPGAEDDARRHNVRIR